MKRVTALIIVLVLTVSLFGACSKVKNESGASDSKIKVVTTIFPIYDWVRNIDKDNNCDISFLMNSGADLHSYQPTADDMVKIYDCDMFIYVGGESDKWVDDALGNASNKDMVVINLLDVLSDRIKEEEIKEGMQSEEESESEDEEEEIEYDEHIWLSLRNAQICVTEIAGKLSAIKNIENGDFISAAEEYNKSLESLDNEYNSLIKEVKNEKKPVVLVFGDRFPFRYMVEDYSIDYYAAFVGCSAESEASFETVKFLANKVDELGLKYVIVLEGGDGKLAQTIINNTESKSAKTITLNSMQNITQQNVDNGSSYIDIMYSNLGGLSLALRDIPYGGNSSTE
ncbi:MAG: metal ABC transporter substrate-binding protein [Eubacterium sp.]|nr:metal ABC transporter substrate-binding protein [Eubacterium sp.]